MIGVLPSGRSRLIRIAALAIAGLGLGAATFVDSRVAVTRETAPDAALALSPHDPDALALKSDLLLAKTADGLSMTETVRTARLAVAARPINARALRVLGMLAQARGKDAEGDRDLALAARASRRDLGVQLWQIERAIAANNVPAVLQNYDVALRTNAASAPLLFPILTAALDDPEIQTKFAPYIRQNPPWLAAMLNHAVMNSKNPAAILSTILTAGRLPDGSAFRNIENRLIVQLAGARQYNAARDLYLRLRGADATVPTDVRLTKSAVDPRFSPMTWQTIYSGGVGGELTPSADDASYQLHLVAEDRQSGPAAQKLLYLANGAYRLSWRQTALANNIGATIAMDLSCIADNTATVAWQHTTAVLPKSEHHTESVVVPASCPVQLFSVRINGGDGGESSEVSLDHFVLQRVPG